MQSSVLGLFVVLALLLSGPAARPASTSEPASREQIEQRLEQIRDQLAALERERDSKNERLHKLQLELADNAASIERTRHELESIRKQRSVLQQTISALRTREQEQLQQLRHQREQLARQLLQGYRSGRYSRLQLLLQPEQPAHSSRLLAYQGYLARRRADVIESTLSRHRKLTETRRRIDRRQQELEQYERDQQRILADLQQQQQTGRRLGEAINDQLQDIGLRLDELRRNRRQLERLLEELRDLFADIPDQLKATDFASLQGRLPWPVAAGRDDLLWRFGQQREQGIASTGVLMLAEAGQPVRAVSRGRVVFADWLRGYGWLIILDHGRDYLSLYGNNRRLLFDPGSWVEAGQQIAVSGDGSGAGMPGGLYFELRHHGDAIDPLAWLQN